MTDPRALPRVTPTAIAEARFEETRQRRYPPRNGIPDPRASWRKTVDPDLMMGFARKAFAACLDAAAPAQWRARVGALLLADVDRRYPPAEMEVLKRHDLTWRYETILVDNGDRAFERFEIPARDLPSGNRTKLFSPNRFRTPAALMSDDVAPVPDETLPLFAAIAEVQRSRAGDFDHAARWAPHFAFKHKRPPTWAEVEEAFPRVGAWLALQRERK